MVIVARILDVFDKPIMKEVFMQKSNINILTLGIATALVFSATLAFAAGSLAGGPITTKSIGTYGPAELPGVDCPGSGCVGELITCADDEGLSPVSQTFYYIRGICDDREAHGLPTCDGRYASYIEECSRASDEHTSDTVISRQTDGAYRICFKEDGNNAELDCASDDPEEVIAEGKTQSHTNHVSGTEILLGVSELILEKDRKWNPDGKKLDWSKNVGDTNVIHSQAQINGGTCPSDGPCGVSSTGVDGGPKKTGLLNGLFGSKLFGSKLFGR